MPAPLKPLLERALRLALDFFEEGSLAQMNAQAALRRIDAALDVKGLAFRNAGLKARFVDLLETKLYHVQEWCGDLGFVVDEFEAMVDEIKDAPVLAAS